MYDLVITGGRLLDPAAGIDEMGDLAIAQGRIVALGRDVVRDEIGQTVRADGLLVTPGLIDLHVHVYEYATDFGVPPDAVGLMAGVSTICDQGSVGELTLPAFRHFIVEHAATEIMLFLNISAAGTPKGSMLPVLHCPESVEVEQTIEAVVNNRNVVRGIKTHGEMGGYARWGTGVVELAVQVAEAAQVPIYLHTGLLFDPGSYPMPGPDEVLPKFLRLLRPGDLMAHCFTAMPGGILGSNGRVNPAVHEAVANGLRLDVGHGAHFSFETAERVLDEGLLPYTISSDVHADFDNPHSRSAYYGLTETMGKLLALDIPLADVLTMATAHPAEVLGETGRLGSLRPGHQADVSLLQVETGSFVYPDMAGGSRLGSQRLIPRGTFKAGRLFEPGEAAGIYQTHAAVS